MPDTFKNRGENMTRLEAFVDAAFAFALTLLVIGGGDNIPSNYNEFMAALKQIPAFAACFANILFFWWAHNTWSRRYGLEDGYSTVLSLILVFLVLIYVYPLKAIYAGAFQFFSGGFLLSPFVMSSAQDLRIMFVVFGIAYASVSVIVVLLYRYAHSKANELGLSTLETYDTVTAMQIWMVSVIIPLLSALIALTAPDSYIVASGFFYATYSIAIPWISNRRQKQRETN